MPIEWRKPLTWSLVAGNLLLPACKPSGTEPIKSPSVIFPIEGEWQLLTPEQRIIRLNQGSFPEYINFDRELLQASTEFYCSATNCNKSVEELISSFYYVGPEEFITRYEEEYQLTEDEKKLKLKGQLEFVTRDGKILINEYGLNHQISLARNNIELVNAFEDYDIGAIYKTSTLIHVLGHLNSPTQNFSIPSVNVDTGVEQITFTEIDGLKFIGVKNTGEPVRLSSFEEAVVEAVAIAITRGRIPYATLGLNYRSGADIVYEINRLTGVDDNELLSLANGELSLPEFAALKWGTLDRLDEPATPEESGYYAMIWIGLHIQRITDIPTTVANISNYLGLQFG